MIIDFINPVQPVDGYSERAFIEILNLILLSDHVNELKRRLALQDRDGKYRSLAGYYKWSFDDYSFTLWQRIGYGSTEYFKDKILEVKHVTFICQDRQRPCIIKN